MNTYNHSVLDSSAHIVDVPLICAEKKQDGLLVYCLVPVYLSAVICLLSTCIERESQSITMSHMKRVEFLHVSASLWHVDRWWAETWQKSLVPSFSSSCCWQLWQLNASLLFFFYLPRLQPLSWCSYWASVQFGHLQFKKSFCVVHPLLD